MIDKYLEDTFDELQNVVLDMEGNMDKLVSEYMADFHMSDDYISNIADNYSLANKSNDVFDDAYKTFIAALLLFLLGRIREGTIQVIADMSSRGIRPVGDEIKKVEAMVGYSNGFFVRGGYLYNLGQMGIIRQRFHDYIIKAVSTGQKVNLFLRNGKAMFQSGDKESIFANYYRRYAFDSVAQTMNTIGLYIADKRGLDKFEYLGGLVKDSRPFCVEHAGNIYTREDAKNFDEMEWRGKIPGVPFLVAVGGYNCLHSIKWLPND